MYRRLKRKVRFIVDLLQKGKFVSHHTKKIVKPICQKGIYKFLSQEMSEIHSGQKVLLVGSAGSLSKLVLERASQVGFEVTTVDIDPKREPDILADICEHDFDAKYDFVIIPEVLEHLHSPKSAIDVIYKCLNSNGKIIATVPFVFPIHDAPHDYYRYTIFGIKEMFSNFGSVTAKENNNWGESIAVLLMRFYIEDSKLKYLVVLIGFFSYLPLGILGRLIDCKNITTGYSICAKK